MILANYDDVSSSFLFGCVFIDCLAAKLSYGQRKVRLLFVDEFRLKVEYFPTFFPLIFVRSKRCCLNSQSDCKKPAEISANEKRAKEGKSRKMQERSTS